MSTEFPSWTYSHEGAVSYSAYDVGSGHVGGNFSMSFFLRTLKPDGLIFQLRRPRLDVRGQASVYFSVYLGTGRVLVSSRPGSAPLTAPVFVADGVKRLLRVEVGQRGRVVFEHRGLRYGIGHIPEAEGMSGGRDAQAYVGGLPDRWRGDVGAWGGAFKGCLQDLRLDAVHLALEAWGGAEDSEESLCLAREAEHVGVGCVSDDTCRVGNLLKLFTIPFTICTLSLIVVMLCYFFSCPYDTHCTVKPFETVTVIKGYTNKIHLT